MARCQHQSWVSSAQAYDMCGKPAKWLGKQPFKTKAEYRCDEHKDDLVSKMPLRKEPVDSL